MLSVHSVEAMAQVQFEEDLIRMAGVPVAGSMSGYLAASFDAHAQLKWSKAVPAFVLDSLAEQLTHKPAQHFSLSDGAHAAMRLGQSV